ncbi:MAG: hypothetical protein FWG36_06465 [Oscillospiraceae bacterium]|nr:hypothetical protein [Oscillospiraceae bacterium]
MKYSAIPMPDTKSKTSVIHFDGFLGCDFRSGGLPDNIRRSPDAENMDFGDDTHTPIKRAGYKSALTGKLDGRINGFHSLNVNGTEIRLIHAGTKLFRLNGSNASEIYSGMNNAFSSSFVWNETLYLLDGKEHILYDGSRIIKPGEKAYIPTTCVLRKNHEAPNLLSGMRINTFCGDNNTRVFFLDAKDLDNTPAYAYVNGALLPEGGGISISRTLGQVSFATIPANDASISIYFSKTIPNGLEKINKCRWFNLEGEKNSAKIALLGNPDTPRTAYISDSMNPNYFPLDCDSYIEDRGCIAPRSQCMFGDDPLYLTVNGMCAAVASLFGDRRIIHNRSIYVNSKLTAENNLQEAFSTISKGKLHLFVNNSVYVADSRLKHSAGAAGHQYEWHRWTNIPATAAANWDEKLWFGTSDGGVYRFMCRAEDGENIYTDDGVPVSAHWTTPLIGTPVTGGGVWGRRKSAPKIGVVLMPFLKSGADIYAAAENEEYRLIMSARTSLSDFEEQDFGDFTFNTVNKPKTITIKNAARRFETLRLMIKNDRAEGLGLTAIEAHITSGANMKGELP